MRIYIKDDGYVNIEVKQESNGTYKYYLENFLIGVYDEDVMKGNFLTVDLERNNTIANELSGQIKDQIQEITEEVQKQIEKMDIKDIEKEAQENMAIEQYLERERMGRKKLAVLDLEREKTKEDKDSKKEEYNTQNSKGENTTEFTTKDVNVKQTISLSEKATDKEDLKKWLGGKIPSEFTKVAVVGRDDMQKLKDENGKVIDNSSTQYGLVAISNNGQVEPLKKFIPELEQNSAAGNNPTNSEYELGTDGMVDKDENGNLSEYQIGSKILKIDKEHGSNMGLEIAKRSPNSNEVISTHMGDSNTTFRTDTSTRSAVMGYNKGTYATDRSVNEAKKHEKYGCEPKTEKDVDGNDETFSHKHDGIYEDCIELSNGEKITFEKLATRWGYYNRDGKPDAEYIKSKIIKETEKNKNIDEIIEDLEEQNNKDPRLKDSRE